jgi:cellulase (glycosyl hydrolase family 5)
MRTPIVSPTLTRLLVLASLSVACSAPSDGAGSDVPDFSGRFGTAPAPGVAQTPGGVPASGTGLTPAGTEGQGTPALVPGAPAASGAVVPGGPAAANPALPGTPSGLDVTILADAVNRTTSSGVGLPMPGTTGQAVGGIEVGSVACFDNIDLTGVQSIEVSYARDGAAVSSSGRFAVLWGGADVTTAENLGEKLTITTGGWDTYQPLNVGLSRAVDGVGTLCFRGLQGNGILNIQSFTLRGTPGTNDGVTNFNVPVPTGPAVAPVRVVGSEVQFGGPGTSVAGNSFFWSNGRYGADLFYTAETVKWLKEDWGSQLVRAAMAVDDNKPQPGTPVAQLGGYLTLPFDNKLNVQKVVNAAIENGMYVIIDWHAHRAEDNTADAVEFFTEMASIYGGFDNVIYEVYNEPVDTSWPAIKNHAQQVIAGIRSVDPDNLVIVGTRFFSQEVEEASLDPINDPNVAYTLHFYAASHGQDLRDKAVRAMANGIALVVTEWGTTPASGLGAPDAAATQQWMDFLKANNISHANWGVADQTEGGASQLVRGASPSGGWTDAQLSQSGRLAKSIIAGW